jgi:RPA family protein
MIKELLAVANKMDAVGLTKEADYIDFVIKKLSGYEDDPESAVDYFDSNRIVKENMTDEEMSFLEALNNFTSSFERLKASSEAGDFDEMSDVIRNMETMAMDTISQKSFERSMSPVGSNIDRYTEGEADFYNHDINADHRRYGPKPDGKKPGVKNPR